MNYSSTQPMNPIGFRIWSGGGYKMRAAHTHADVEVNFLIRGHLQYLFGGSIVEVQAGRPSVFWGGIPHQTLHKSGDLRGVWITLPLEWILRINHLTQLRDQLLAGHMVMDDPESENIRTDPLRFQQWRQDFESGDPNLQSITAQEICLRLARLPTNRSHQPTPRTTNNSHRQSGPSNRLGPITEFIGNHYLEPLSVEQIAAATNLHPKYLLQLFHQLCGITLWDYVIQLRLAHAKRLLLTTDQTVLSIALDSGFGSQSAFYHAFRKTMPHTSPATFRRSAEGPALPATILR